MVYLPWSLLLLLRVALAYQQQPLHAHRPPPCIHTSTAEELNSLLESGGQGHSLILCPNAHFTLDSHGPPITFTARDQSIYTAGVPEDHTRAIITIAHPKGFSTGDLTTAIRADCDECSGVRIRNIVIDGGRNELGGEEGGDALILVGGDGGEQEVRHVEAFNARGYAVLHASEGKKGSCERVAVVDNVFHSSGDAPMDLMLNSELARLRDGPPPYKGQERPGKWTDGISIACKQSIVHDNTLKDLSGVAIALRGAPGTQILQNTIVAKDRDMLSGISIVSHPAFIKNHHNLGGVVIRENSIHAASAMIRVGIATGTGPWSSDEIAGNHEIAFGSEIVRNRLSSYIGYFGYAIAISDAKSIVVMDNAVSASIWGFQTSACYTRPTFALPAPLIRDARSVMGKLQPEFRELHFGFLLCVGPGSASSSHDSSRHEINGDYLVQEGVRRKAQGGGRMKDVKGKIPKGEVGERGKQLWAMQKMRAKQREVEKESGRHPWEERNKPVVEGGWRKDRLKAPRVVMRAGMARRAS